MSSAKWRQGVNVDNAIKVLFMLIPMECTLTVFPTYTRGQYGLKGIVVACVRPSVRPSPSFPCENSSPVQARIAKFGP